MIKRFFELFDFKSWSWIHNDSLLHEAEFTVKGNKYRCRIANVNEYKGIWDLTFMKIEKNMEVTMSLTKEFVNASKVFSNIISIVESFIESEEPNVIIWQSISTDRDVLYRKFGDYLSKKYGYLNFFKYYGDTEHIVYYITRFSKEKTDRYINNISGLFDKYK